MAEMRPGLWHGSAAAGALLLIATAGLARNLERFEQGRSQHAVLPSGLFDNYR
ncbi:MAG: hypothetical protein ABSG26_16165 [Bryobacteraceae bacterium]|jgi:hypothetical protein